MPPAPAAAAGPPGLDGDVPDLPGEGPAPRVEPVVQDQAPADAGAGPDGDHVPGPPGGPDTVLRQHGHADVVAHLDRHAQARFELRPQGHVDPVQIGGQEDRPAG